MKKALTVLTKKQLTALSKELPDWSVNSKGTFMTRTVTVKDYVAALVLAARITVHAEILNHHPEVTLSYGKLKIKLTTHEVKGLTHKDVELATRVNTLAEKA